MTLTDVGRLIFGPGVKYPAGGTLIAGSTVVLNDSDNSVAGIFILPKNGTIDRILLSVSAKSGTSTTVLYNIGIVTVDASGNPTSTPYGGSAIETRSVNALATNQNIITLATPATGVGGDVVAARIWPQGTVVPDGSNNITIRSRIQSGGPALPYEAEWATAWTKNASYPQMTLQYNAASGDTYVGVPLAASTTVTSAFGSGSTPNEIGALFQVPFACTCVGVGWYHRQTTLAATGRLGLYDNAGVLQRSQAYPAGAFGATNIYGLAEVEWTPYDLLAATNYRIGHLATSVDTRSHAELTLASSAQRASIMQGPSWQRSSRTNSGDTGAWTDLSTAMPLMWLILSQIDFTLSGGGGGGSGHGGGAVFI